MEHHSEESGETVPRVHPAVPGVATRSPNPQWRRVLQIGVGLGVAAGVAVGATALAGAATGGSSGGSSPKTSPTPTWHGPSGRHFSGRGFGGFGFGFGGMGSVLHGEATVNGPNGYETIEVQTGTVTSLTNVSGSTWNLVVTSADKTALSYTVNSGTSVNGGESGISSVKKGDKVGIVAVVSKGTATAKTLVDSTTLQANRGSWAPMGQGPPMGPLGPPMSGSSTS